MTEKQFTVEDIEDMIYQLGVLITDASQGLLITTLKKNFFEEYKNQYLGFETAANANLKLILLDALRNDITSDKSCKDLNYIKTYIEQHFDPAEKIMRNISGQNMFAEDSENNYHCSGISEN